MFSTRLHTVGHYPVLGGNNACQHCFCSPHTESSSIHPPLLCCEHLANNSEEFELYKKFWKWLWDIGWWQHPCNLEIKITTKDDRMEIFPPCIIQSSLIAIISWEYMIGYFRSLQQIEKFYVNTKGSLIWPSSDFLAQFQLYHIM